MSQIAMLLSNAFRPDPRVLKEAGSLAQAGYNVTIIAWDRSRELSTQEEIQPGVNIYRIQSVPSDYGIGARQLLRLPRFWAAAYQILTRLRPEVVHCHDFDTLPIGLIWGKIHHVPVVYDAHEYYADLCKPRLTGWSGNLLYLLIRYFEHNGAHLAQAVITVDQELAAVYSKYNRRVIVVGHYPPLELAERPASVFSRADLTLIYVGRLSVDRGLLVYAEILRELRRIGIPARLRLAGVFTPAVEKQSFLQHAKGLEEYVDIAGWVHFSHLNSELSQADIGLAILLPEPRYVAATPVKLFEYMAVGLPVIASRFPPIAGIVQTIACGELVDPLGDPKLVARMIEAWWHNPDLPRSMGQRGRQAVIERYNWETLMNQVAELYSRLTS